MQLQGHDIDFVSLVKPEYIGSRKGSSLAELKKAAQDNGLHAHPVKNMGLKELKASKYPIILHVKSEGNEYNHFELFLGNDDGQAIIFDPPNPVQNVPFHKLPPVWDGTGLIVSKEPIDLAAMFAPARKRFAMFAGIVLAIIAAIRFSRKYFIKWFAGYNRKWQFAFSIIQGAGLTVFALLIGMVFHFVSEAGFLAHPNATEPVVQANLTSFIPKISADDILSAKDDNVIIIDARRQIDFDAGHIQGAINIPVSLCAAGRNSRLAKVEKNKKLVIYCQSAGCPYAEKVALNLKEDGFKNIAIYKAGWVDWKNTHKGELNETEQ